MAVSRKPPIAPNTIKIRLNDALKLRLDYEAFRLHKTVSATIRDLLEQGMDDLEGDHDFNLWLHGPGLPVEDIPLEAVPQSEDWDDLVHAPDCPEESSTEVFDPPAACPHCGESKMPIPEDPLWLINESDRTIFCNNCAHKIDY